MIEKLFTRIANAVAHFAGLPPTFAVCLLIVAVWALTGPIFDFSDTWQLVINTGTTIVTFLMVFLIQNTQNRDATAIHLKLDELIKAMHGARNRMVSLEDCSDDELEELRREFHALHEQASAALEERRRPAH